MDIHDLVNSHTFTWGLDSTPKDPTLIARKKLLEDINTAQEELNMYQYWYNQGKHHLKPLMRAKRKALLNLQKSLAPLTTGGFTFKPEEKVDAYEKTSALLRKFVDSTEYWSES